ncbi:MAG: cation:proton antiporter [Spirochaetes bacterium]|nr:cation:proton antiporter [Spirochaetota bacterium]
MLRHEIVAFLLGLGALLGVARLLGELAVKLRQPMILGEVLAGILLGPTVFGLLFPAAQGVLYPVSGPVLHAYEGVITIALVMFLLVEGMGIELEDSRGERRPAFFVSLLGVLVPLLGGFCLAYFKPSALAYHGPRPLAFALFFGTVLSITSLNIVSRILKDNRIFRTEAGVVTHAASVVGDVAGWLLFAAILTLFRVGPSASPNPWLNVMFAFIFAGLMLTVGRFLIDRILPFVHAHATWPEGMTGFVITLAFVGAAFSQWIGVHALFGALLVGMAVSGSPWLAERNRRMTQRIVFALFAPLFFAWTALSVDWVKHFNLPLVLGVFGFAVLVKVGAGFVGSLWGGLSPRMGFLVGFGINARGAIAILLCYVALRYQLISEELYVALSLTALATSALAAPLIRFLSGKKAIPFWSFFHRSHFIPRLRSRSADEAIHDLCQVLAAAAHLSVEDLIQRARERELVMPSGVEGEIAIIHLPFPGLRQPLISAGIAENGLDFRAVDHKPARVVFLVASPAGQGEQELEILEEISDTFIKPGIVELALEARDYTEFLAILKTSSAEHG